MGTDLTIGRWLADRARGTPRRTAIDTGDRLVTYGQLYRAASDVASSFDLSSGDRVAVLAGNCAEYVAAVFACAMAGLVVVPLNWRLSPSELAFQLEDSGASAIVVEPAHGDLADRTLTLAHARPRRVDMAEVVSAAFDGACGGAPRGEDGLAPPADRARVRFPAHDGSPLFIVYTSGTTGQPKGAVLTHANVFWTNLSFDRTTDISSTDVVLQVLPQFHIGGWNCQPLLAWWKGAAVVLERTFEPGRVLALIGEKGVTTMMGVPATYQFIAEHPGFDGANLSSLRYVLVGGAPMPEALLRRWEERGVRIMQGYGLTEASPNVLCLPAEDASRRLGFAGKPYPHVDVALADPATGALVEGPAIGELVVDGPNVFAGYWGNPAATAQAMRGGWLHTGDVAERDEEGFYRIRDRIKDMYISGGENVYPAEVETTLSAHPAIVEAAVIAVPDRRWGEAGLAVVVARPGAELGEEEVRAWCAGRLARFKVPRDVRFVEALPRSAMNKVSKTELRDRFGAEAP